MPAWLYRLLEVVCLWFAGLGLLVAFAGDTAPFAAWREAAAQALFGRASLPASIAVLVPTTFGILGGSIFGKWIAAWLVVRGPLARGERWAWRALAAGLLAWWIVDSAVSVSCGATFNVWMINLAPLVLFGGPLAMARRYARGVPEYVPRRSELVLGWVCAAFAGFGIVVALGSTSVVFEPYRAAMARAFFGRALPADATIWIAFIYGPIGATFLGHFTMLAWAVGRDPEREEAWRIVGLSMLAWFLADSLSGVLHRAWFNLALVNVPSLVALAVPWWIARPRARIAP